MELADWQERDWKRAQRWADACTRGDCAYAAGQNPGQYLGEGCPGWHCTLYWEETRPVLRYCACIRSVAWRKFQREHRRPVQRVPRKLGSDEV
jgi:hypothetical protein